MLTSSNWLLSLLFWMLLLLLSTELSSAKTVTWGQVNKYASTLYTKDVYLMRVDNKDANDIANGETDVVDAIYGSQNTSQASDYTITAVHAYDMTPLEENDGNGGTAFLLSGGVGHHHAVIRFERLKEVIHLPFVHFQLVIYGVVL